MKKVLTDQQLSVGIKMREFSVDLLRLVLVTTNKDGKSIIRNKVSVMDFMTDLSEFVKHSDNVSTAVTDAIDMRSAAETALADAEQFKPTSVGELRELSAYKAEQINIRKNCLSNALKGKGVDKIYVLYIDYSIGDAIVNLDGSPVVVDGETVEASSSWRKVWITI